MALFWDFVFCELKGSLTIERSRVYNVVARLRNLHPSLKSLKVRWDFIEWKDGRVPVLAPVPDQKMQQINELNCQAQKPQPLCRAERSVLREFLKSGSFTRQQFQNFVGKSKATAQKRLSRMLAKGKIKRLHRGKKIQYFCVEQAQVLQKIDGWSSDGV